MEVIQDNKTAPQGEDLSEWGYFVRCVTTKYSDFSGRARRKEWWGFILFQSLIFIALMILFATTYEVERIFDPDTMQYMSQNPDEEEHIDSLMGGNVFFWAMMIVGFLMLVPSVAVTCRRFHDVGISAGLFLVPCGLTILNTIFSAHPIISLGPCAEPVKNIMSTISALSELMMLVIALIPGKTGPNAYGPNPKPAPTSKGYGQASQNGNTTSQGEDLSLWGYFVRCITTKYSDFSGRANRKEWWSFILFQLLVLIAPMILFVATSVIGIRSDPYAMEFLPKDPYDTNYIYYLLTRNPFIWPVITVGLWLLVPLLAVTCRRFHDAEISNLLLWVVCELTILINIVNLLALIERGTDGVITTINFIFLSLIWLVVLVVAFIPGKTGPNAYGPDPKPAPTYEGYGQI